MNENRDNPETTERYDVGPSDDELANEEGPTTFDVSADLKAVIAFSNEAEGSEVSKTMVLPEQALSGAAVAGGQPPSASQPHATQPKAPYFHPSSPAPPHAAASAQPPAPAVEQTSESDGFAKVLVLSAVVTLLIVGALVGAGVLIYALL